MRIDKLIPQNYIIRSFTALGLYFVSLEFLFLLVALPSLGFLFFNDRWRTFKLESVQKVLSISR